MKAEKLPSGNWRMRVCIGKDANGKYRYKSVTAKTKKDCKELALEIMRNKPPSDDCTVGFAIERYINNRSAVLSPSTIAGYDKLLRNSYDSIKDEWVSKINSERLQSFVNDRAKDKSPKTVKNEYGLLRSSLLAFNPDLTFTVKLPQKRIMQRHIPTDADVKRLLETATGEMRIAILLASIGTLRRGEICALKYEDIRGNVIHVHADMVEDKEGNAIYKEIPKTSSSDRYIEFPEKVIKEIGQGEGFIVPLEPKQLSSKWLKIRRKAKIFVRFHDLRHYAASCMHAIGCSDQFIMERGGWSSDTVLKSIYRHNLDDFSKTFSDRANKHFDNLL